MTNIMALKNGYSIGQVSRRTGASISALRFYEDKGLIQTHRNGSGHRVFLPSDIRRISFILIAQNLGFSLARIKDVLSQVPIDRSLNKKHWDKIGKTFAQDIDQRIARLTRLRDTLSGCMGCGCLSLKACKLYNPDDIANEAGPGPQNILRGRT